MPIESVLKPRLEASVTLNFLFLDKSATTFHDGIKVFFLPIRVWRLPRPSWSLAAQNSEGYYEPGVTEVEGNFANPQEAKILRF